MTWRRATKWSPPKAALSSRSARPANISPVPGDSPGQTTFRAAILGSPKTPVTGRFLQLSAVLPNQVPRRGRFHGCDLSPAGEFISFPIFSADEMTRDDLPDAPLHTERGYARRKAPIIQRITINRLQEP